MPYQSIQPSRHLRRRVRECLDPVLACQRSWFTPRFAAELPTLCHAIALEVGRPTDWAFAVWSLLRTWASRGIRRRTTTPNHLTWQEAAEVVTAARGWQPRTVHQRLAELVELGFAREESLHGERCLFWVSSEVLLAHLRARWPLAADRYDRLHWLARGGDQYRGASWRRTFLPEIISFKSLAKLRAALSQSVRLDAASVNLGRTKQTALLGGSATTTKRRVAQARRSTHERVEARYHQVYRPPYYLPAAQQQEIINRIVQASRKAYANGETPSPLLVKQSGNQLVLVRQLPSRSSNRRVYQFHGAEYQRRNQPRVVVQDLRPRTSWPTQSEPTVPSAQPSATSTSPTETQSVDPLASAPRTVDRILSVIETAPAPHPVSAFPITNLHRQLREHSLEIHRTYLTNRLETQQVGVTVHQRCHYDRDQYTEQLIHAVYDWDPELIDLELGHDQLGPAPPRSAYRQQLRRGRPTLGYFRRFTKLRRPTRAKLVEILGPDCFARTKRRYSPDPTKGRKVR